VLVHGGVVHAHARVVRPGDQRAGPARDLHRPLARRQHGVLAAQPALRDRLGQGRCVRGGGAGAGRRARSGARARTREFSVSWPASPPLMNSRVFREP